MIGLEESAPWNINSTTGFIFEKTHGSDAFFTIDFEFDLLNSSTYVPYVCAIAHSASNHGNSYAIYTTDLSKWFYHFRFQ